MKVTETVRDNRTGETYETSWGEDITSDMTVIASVANIIDHERARQAGDVHSFQGRFTTISINIVL